jgi:hypothetical protein
MKTQLFLRGFLAIATMVAIAPGQAQNTVPVTPDNFVRAEADLVFGSSVREGALGKFVHHREPMRIDFPIVRPNRDTLYSLSVFDLDAGPVTITLPDAGKRFMSMQVIDEDHYTPAVYYGAGSFTVVMRSSRWERPSPIRTVCLALGARSIRCGI